MENKNYGLNLELEKKHRSPNDWVFGAMSDPCITDLGGITGLVRLKYLPRGEVQVGKEDMFDCATRGPINILETKFNWLLDNKKIHPKNMEWFTQYGFITEAGFEFSDAFVAINSGTTRQGNSLIAPLDAIHRYGLIPKRMLPLEPWMTFDDYHNPNRITPEMMRIGQEFISRFPINYEVVSPAHYVQLLKDDLLNVGGHAWPKPVDGVYPKNDYVFNHCFVLFDLPAFQAFDNYVDPVDGDFVKTLAPDYTFLEYGYRVYISAQISEPKQKSWLRDFWDRFIKIFK